MSSSSPSKLITSIAKLCSRYHTARFFSSNGQQIRTTRSSGYGSIGDTHRRNFSFYSKGQRGPPLPSQPPSSSLKWILGTMLAITLPFAGNKGGPLLEFKRKFTTTVYNNLTVCQIEIRINSIINCYKNYDFFWLVSTNFIGDVDSVVETIEEVVEIVEKVAEMVDKVAENVSEGLPETGNFKKVVDIVEHVAEKTAKDAQIIGNAIDKFQEVEEKVENVVETLGDQANAQPKKAKG